VVLDIGDLTFLYDNSSLIFANKYAKNLTIIINNNSGGQIFNLLPQQKDLSKEYDEWFITPHTNISIKKLADTYNCFYEKVENPTKMKKALQNSFAKNGVSIIEVLQNSDYKQFNEKIKILVDKITINS
jgi:2-succinyl-5-enolpyruvyl-6-hydroxy-3-cyclohexene-1-carboxylate synthase